MTRLLGLYRETEYSPGRHRSNDAALLEQIADALRTPGCAVDLVTVEDAVASGAERSASLVFSMCQGRAALDLLQRWAHAGARIINSPQASLNTYRERLPSLMLKAGVPFPATRFVATRAAQDAAIDVNGGLWLKRGDVHAAISADVQWISSSEELRAGLAEFASRGIERAALQHHEPGGEIKFYGVTGGRFFHWLPASPEASAPVASFDVESLQRIAEKAAAAAGLDIFGGDAIVGPDGRLTLIDLNDWPSFAPCRDRASVAIADFIAHSVHSGDPVARATI